MAAPDHYLDRMATIFLRSVLLRALPTFLATLFALTVVPRTTVAVPVGDTPIAAAASATVTPDLPTEQAAEPLPAVTAYAEVAPADDAAVLFAQSAADVRGSRAPPGALA